MTIANSTDSSDSLRSQLLARAALELLNLTHAEAICLRLTSFVKELIPEHHVKILLADSEKDRLTLLIENGELAKSLGVGGELLHQGAVGQVFQSRQPVWFPMAGEATPVEFAVPLVCKDRVIGVLSLREDTGLPILDSSQVAQLQALAALAAASLETTRLYQVEKERRWAEMVFIEAERRLSCGLKPSELPRRILEELALVVPFERGSLLLQEGQYLRIAAQHGFPEDDRTKSLLIPLREGDVYKQIEASCQPVVIDDVTQEQGWSQVEWLPLNLSWLGLPLFSKDKVVGMVSLTRRERGAFSQQDVLLATTFALQAAVALENAALYEEITRFNQQLEEMVQQRTEELRLALGKLERMDKNKSDFINVVAHELRTPLTIMRGYLQMVQADASVQASPYLLQILEGLLRGTQRLQEIINNMLDVVRIDNQVLDLKLEIMTVSSLTSRIQADFQSYLEDRLLALKLRDLEGLPLIKGDSGLLLKVLQNVVINAIKYTPDGGEITISGRLAQDPQYGECVEILIQDTGIGIDPDHHELIFEKFYSTGSVALHSSGKTTFKGGGPGLGLSIARGIVQAHRGRIWVESPGYDEATCPGSCFHILLPVMPTG